MNSSKTIPDKKEKELFFTFLREWKTWGKTGEEPKSADRDLRNSLALQQKRLQKHHLEKEIVLDRLEEEVIRKGDIIPAEAYNQGLHFTRGRERVSFIRKKDGKQLGKYRRSVGICETILDAPDEKRVSGDSIFNCPNCGGVSTIKELLEGCPYCGTHFFMSDLYPKVSNFYTLRQPPIEKYGKRQMIFMMIATGLGMALYSFFINGKDSFQQSSILLGVVELLLIGVFGGIVLGYFLWAFLAIGYLFYEAGLSFPMLVASIGAKKKINQMLASLNPGLYYEYFEGKAISLIRNILFSDDLSNNSQYNGAPLKENFANLIDISYRGVMSVKKIRLVKNDRGEDKIQAEVNLYLENYYVEGDKIQAKREIASLCMQHDAKSEVEADFSIHRVRCSSCAASFDALRQKKCPYCGTPYDSSIRGWLIASIEVH